MTEQFVVKFDYGLEMLQAFVKEAESVDVTNLELVKENHKKFVKIRTTIKKQEKEMVDEANKFRNTVFEKRDEYLAITLPIEEKFKKIIDDEEARKIMEIRKEQLAGKKQQLSFLDISPVSDDFILGLDDAQWVAFYQEKMTEHQNNMQRKADDKKQEEERIKREEQIKKEAEERAEKDKAEALKKAERDKIEAVEKVKREAQEKIDKEKREAEEKVRKEKLAQEEAQKKAEQEQARMEADKKYQDFLSKNSFNNETDIIQKVGNEVKIYRLVATFSK